MKKHFAVLVTLCASLVLQAQPTTTFPANGAADKRHTIFAFTNAHIQTDPETVLDKATMIIRDGIITDIGVAVVIPKGAVVYDMQGKWIYPSFIDPYTTYGMPEIQHTPWAPGPHYESNRKGTFGWNDALKPETDASRIFSCDNRAADEYRSIGFGAVMSYPADGIVRGSATCITLNAEDGENAVVIKDRVASCFSFDKGSSRQDYPSSLMGAIALLRQTYHDAAWYQTAKNKIEYNATLEAWNTNLLLPQIFETTDKWNIVRADKIGDEFKTQYIFKGSGNEYQRMEEIKATNGSFILPLNFPQPYDVEDPYDAELLEYTDLKHWELAPLNPGAFEKYAISFALTASGLKEKRMFWPNLRKAIKYGLSEKAALKALTVTPAIQLGVSDKAGMLKKGMLANFVIVSGNVFQEDAIIWENWVRGRQYIIKDYNTIDLRGTYNLIVGQDGTYALKIEGDQFKLKASFAGDTSKAAVSVSLEGNAVTINYASKSKQGTVRLSGSVNATTKFMSGRGQLPDGTWIDWMASQTAKYIPKAERPVNKDSALAAEDIPALDEVIYPFSAYGRTKADSLGYGKFSSTYASILIRNATVWTNEADSILPNTDVLVVGGKISAIGKNLGIPSTGKTMIVDGTGKHLTAGIIDEHSHIAIGGGVNEGGQVSSAECRIGDVVYPDDVNVYRQLAGGVVASQLLHGSANPIGGQSAIIKLRWGASAEQMKIDYAPGFIKFALGENVKQCNWGDYYTIRFPQTRMGVEQVYYDYFTRAKEYNAQWAEWRALPVKAREKISPPRRDLDLEAVGEILAGTRNITCHSYVQSELMMLMHVADSMHFRVNTFTHILEGYKVADEMKSHNINGSTFSDWWAYKYEVKDAIPYNAALMTRMGINVAINSDDAEMARRLNQEAAKSIKYGGLTEVQAFKMVTLNPAKMLHLDQRMGSIKIGKDADLVLWSDNPVSIYAKVEKTIVDGKLLYDMNEDAMLRTRLMQDKAQIIQKMINVKNGGAPVQTPRFRKPRYWDCEDMIEEGSYLNEENQ
jgi:imidazolonepropionase-like amidohydrolase